VIDFAAAHESALRCDVGVREFWGLCPRELDRVIQAARWRLDQLRDRILAGAWAVERFSRVGTLPPMQEAVDVLVGRREARPQPGVSSADAESFARRMVAAFGGTVIERSKEVPRG
jgi:hypothetical protein